MKEKIEFKTYRGNIDGGIHLLGASEAHYQGCTQTNCPWCAALLAASKFAKKMGGNAA